MTSDRREHIARIRRERKQGSQINKDDLNSAIRLLAEDLYSKPTHFVLELIQNAEDNKYVDQLPSLSFRLLKRDPTGTQGCNGALIIQNNETGFSSEDVATICRIGKTTKSKTEGYIGEKGIGFKSVFRVTSNPYIFSNGYRFCLPEHDKETGLGYIVPRWVENAPAEIDSSRTAIILPLDKPEFGYEQIEKMLRDIEPETILFLSKLKEIQVKMDTGYTRTILRDDSRPPLVCILVNGERRQGERFSHVEKYLLRTRRVDKPSDINPENRKGIDRCDVSIAFPLNEGENSPGKVFAYLPVKSDTGLPFLINADFLLTSSREDIKEDETWNKWLRDSVGMVFVEAFVNWLDSPEYRCLLYGFIPLQAHTSLLEPTVKSIQNYLRDRECVLTGPDDKKCRPGHTRLAPSEFRSLLSKSYPKALLETRVVLSEIEIYRTQLEKALWVKQITPGEITSCFEDKHWIEQHDQDWLLECYRFLSSQSFDDGLANCPIVPIEAEGNVQWSCDDEQPIYFDCDEECTRILAEVPECAQVKLAFLDKRFFERIRDDEGICDWMTNTLKIYPFSKHNYSVDVMTWLKEHYQEISESDLIAVTSFLSHFAEMDIDFKDIPVALADGRRVSLSKAGDMPGVQAVVTPEALDTETGWQYIWKTEEDRKHFIILSNSYSKKACDSLIRRKLLVPYPEPRRRKDEHYYDQYFDHLAPGWMSDDGCVINEMEANALLGFLKQYAEEIPKWKYLHYSRPNGRHRFRCAESSEATIVSRLKSLRWLPTSQGMAVPGGVFLPTKVNKEVLGDSVPYFEGDLSENVLKLLGAKIETTAEDLVSVLEQHSDTGDGSIDFAERVYRILSTRELSDSILDRLRLGRIILSSTDSGYRWVSSGEVMWKDRKDVLGDTFIYLEKEYPKLKEFFVDTIHVKEDADTESFAQRWLVLQDESGRVSREIESILTIIYREIQPTCKMDAEEKPVWWHSLLNKAKIWTQSKKFENPKSVYVPDDGDLKQVFQSRGISFAWRPEKDSFSDWEALYRSLGLPYLSETVDVALAEYLECDATNHPDFLTRSARALIAAWLREERPTEYQRLLKGGLIDSLLNTEEMCSPSLKVVYRLKETEVFELCESFWERTKNRLVVVKTSGGRVKNTIARMLARALMPNRPYKDLADWIELVLGEKDWEWRIEQKGWRVPDEVRAWLLRDLNPGGQAHTNRGDAVESASTETDADLMDFDEKLVTEPDSINVAGEAISGASFKDGDKRTPDSKKREPSSKRTVLQEVACERGFDYRSEFINAFSRPGMANLKEKMDPDNRAVRDPLRRREKEAEGHRERITAEPDAAERRKRVERTILEGPDEGVRKTLEEWYGGKCQICGETFQERQDGRPFFVANYMVPRKLARQVDTYANALCLCADHFAKWQHGAVEGESIIQQISSLKPRAEGGDGNLRLRVRLCGEESDIRFDERHVIALQELLNVISDEEAHVGGQVGG